MMPRYNVNVDMKLPEDYIYVKLIEADTAYQAIGIALREVKKEDEVYGKQPIDIEVDCLRIDEKLVNKSLF
jgi:hypothetical protein